MICNKLNQNISHRVLETSASALIFSICSLSLCGLSTQSHAQSHQAQSHQAVINQALFSQNLSSQAQASQAQSRDASSCQGAAALADSFTPEMRAAYEGFQADADVIRLRQLKYWVGLIEAYHDKTGHYPLQQQTDGRLTVFIATPKQQAYTYELSGSDYVSMATFVSTLEQGLGHSIEEHYDPQYAPDAKPNYYIYMLNGDDYFFAIHTHQNYPFGRHVAPNYNKVEVSNRYSPYTPKILTPEMLFESSAYQKAAAQPLQVPDFFKARDALTRHAAKESHK